MFVSRSRLATLARKSLGSTTLSLVAGVALAQSVGPSAPAAGGTSFIGAGAPAAAVPGAAAVGAGPSSNNGTAVTITNLPGTTQGLGNDRAGGGELRVQPSAAKPGNTAAARAPNEFQRFVQTATGVALPLFGQRYFDEADQTYAPIDRVPVPADYVLGPGDELYIRAWGSIDVDYRATIDRNGQISLPRIGTFSLIGLKANEAQAQLESQIGRLYKNFSLNVTLGQLRSIQVFVVGQAAKPGSYTVSSLSTLINVVFASGGPGQNGSMRRVQLKRGERVVTELDLYDFVTKGRKDKDARLQPGDVIVFTPAGPRVALLGALDTPAIYELKPEGETIADVLNYGGGTGAATNVQSAQLERIDASNPRAPRTVNTVSLTGAIGDNRLRDGDVLTLFGVSPQFANAITLRGNVASPLRYPYTPGMRVSQLIPDKDALIVPDYYRRKNKLVQFTDDKRVNLDELNTDIKQILDEPNWDYAAIERLNRQTLTTEVIPFNLAKAVVDRDPAHDKVLQPGDVVTIFSRKDIRVPIAKQTRLVRVEGEVATPGIYPVMPGETLTALLTKAGGLTPQAYVYGIEFSREETRRQQQLALEDAVKRLEAQLASGGATQMANLSATNEKAAEQLQAAQMLAAQAQLQRLKTMRANGRISLELPTDADSAKALPELPLEDGDRVLVPPTPAFVFAVGAVANNNALLWRSGRTLKNYLDVAGPDVDADMDNMFVVRADGSVVHANRRGWFRGIEKVELMPGDTVVVPGKTNRETFWTAFVRGLKDWSQVLYQFGLTAAAIHTLRN